MKMMEVSLEEACLVTQRQAFLANLEQEPSFIIEIQSYQGS
jgi:hypothetical protein